MSSAPNTPPTWKRSTVGLGGGLTDPAAGDTHSAPWPTTRPNTTRPYLPRKPRSTVLTCKPGPRLSVVRMQQEPWPRPESICWRRCLDGNGNAAEARWAQGLAVCRLYVARHGSLAGVGPETRLGQFRLGHWIQRCRADYRAGDVPTERSIELETLPGWSWADPRRQNWRNAVNLLGRYVSQTGHAAPAQREVIDGFPLGSWVAKQRRDQRRGLLSSDRAAELSALPGWQWDPLEQRWQRGLSALSKYAAAHGHAQPACSQRFDSYPVGEWVRAQRTAHDNGRLSPHRAAKLEALPGWCWITPKHVER